jgi:hypothetical protein
VTENYQQFNCMKDKVILVLTGGFVVLLFLIVIADFTLAFETGRPPDSDVIELLKMSMTGIIGIVAGYIAGKSN